MRPALSSFFIAAIFLSASVKANTLSKRHNAPPTPASASDASQSDDYDQKTPDSSSSSSNKDMKYSAQNSTSSDAPTEGVSQACQTYYSANTSHAVCGGDQSVMCTGGCTGGVFAQDCKLNATSTPCNQTCTVEFARTSASAYVCTTSEGAFTCTGPISGEATCYNCVSKPRAPTNGNAPSETDQQGGAGAGGPGSADNYTTHGDTQAAGYAPPNNGSATTDSYTDTGANSTSSASWIISNHAASSAAIGVLVGTLSVFL